jgi:hypothetical protein
VRAAPWSSAGLHLNNAKHFITRVNELQGQATTLEVSTVVVLHSRIDEARQAAWPGRRGCTPRPSQPSQLRRRLTTRLVGSRIALRITEIPPGILIPVTDKTRTGQPGRGQVFVGFLPSRNPEEPDADRTTRTRTGFRRVPRSRNPLESGSPWLLKA